MVGAFPRGRSAADPGRAVPDAAHSDTRHDMYSMDPPRAIPAVFGPDPY